MKVEIKNNQLVITIDMQEPTLSATGKTLVVASTHGNQPTAVVVKGQPVVIGLNAYIRNVGTVASVPSKRMVPATVA